AGHPRGTSFVVGTPGETRLWDTQTGEPLGAPVPFPVAGADFHPSGRYLALGSGDGGAHLWNGVVNKPIGPPIPHPGRVGRVVFPPGGGMLATVGFDGMTRLWKVQTPVAGTPAQVKRMVEVLTASAMDEAGGMRPLQAPEVAERRQQLPAEGNW